MIQSKNPNYREYVRLKVKRNKFLQHVGFTIDKIDEGAVEGHLDMQEFHEQQNGFLHGGMISTLCDMACGYSAYSLVEEGQQVFTVEIKVSYLRPGIGQKAIARGKVIKAGSMFHFCEAEIWMVNQGVEKLIATASSTMGVVTRKVNDKYGD